MASFSSTYPSQRPVFTLDAANAGRLDPRCSFTRASTGMFFGAEKVLSSENLLLQSEDFTTTWAASEAGGSGGATAPDGGSDAYTITCYTASSKSPRVVQSLSGKLTANTQYTMVGHVKAGTATHGYISFRGNNVNNYAYAQIEFASPGSVSTGGAGFSGISGTVTALGSSWYRLTLTATTGSDVSGAFAFLGPNDGSAFGVSGYATWDTAAETLEIWGAQISSTNTKVYDSPTTTQIARSYQTKLQTAASGAARFEHSATDGQSAGTSLGILVESQSTNLLNFSDDTTDSYWGKTEVSASGSVAVGPTGELNAGLLVGAATSTNHYLQRTIITTTASTTYTYSLYVKSAGVTKFTLLMFQNGSPYTQFGKAAVDLSSATINGTVGSGATIESASNGWFRVSVTGDAVSTSSSARIWLQDDSGNFTHTPNGYDGLLVAGQQFEANSFPSSLIFCNGSATTRALDSLSVATADIGYTGGPLTIVGEVGGGYGASAIADLRNSSGSSDNYFLIWKASAAAVDSSAFTVYSKESGTLQTTQNITGSGGATKVAVCMDTNNISSCADGGTVTTDTSVVIPDGLNKLWIGNAYSGYQLNSNLKRIALYNEALSNSNLQALTS